SVSMLAFAVFAEAKEAATGFPRVNPIVIEHESKWEIDLHQGDENGWKVRKIEAKEYDLDTRSERDRFRAVLADILRRNEAAGKENEFLPGDARRALEDSEALVTAIDQPGVDARDRYEYYANLRETINAFNHNFEYPAPDIWIGALPFKALAELSGHRIMTKSAKRAINLDPYSKLADASMIDPVPSSFWQPRPIESISFLEGFSRQAIPDITRTVCTYEKPKTSYGVHGGFEIDCNGTRWKMKFGIETHTEPFNSRLIWALGYNAKPVDFAPVGYLRYDRRVFTEYNSRKDFFIRVRSLVGFTYQKYNLQKEWDVFADAIAGAVLKDGRQLSMEELKKQLVHSGANAFALRDSDFDPQFETQIDRLVMRPSSIEKEDDARELGSWDWCDLDHRDRRELRGFGIVAAWLNLYDVRADNTSLDVEKDEQGRSRLVHYISDVGSGHGTANRVLKFKSGVLNDFPWDLFKYETRIESHGPPGKTAPVQKSEWVAKGFGTVEENDAFERIQPEDGKWIARKIARVSDAQLEAGLVAAGYPAAEVVVMTAKLKSRRAQIIRAFGIQNESATLREMASPNVDREFSYDPRTAPRPEVRAFTGAVHSAPVGRNRVVNGYLTAF
ncbi:MAG: hypothetical protein V4760_15535, partial [Bdellovibrionota bacterium]